MHFVRFNAALCVIFLFASIARADAPPTPTQKIADDDEKALKDLVDRRLPEVRFNANSFSDVLQFMRDITGANIVVDWPALDAAGVARDAPVTYRAHDAKFGDIMNTILAKAAGDPKKLAYCTDAGVLFISTPEGVKQHQNLWKTHAAMETGKLKEFKATLPDLRFNANAFSDALDFLRDATGYKIECDWDQLHKDGIERDTLRFDCACQVSR